MDLNIWVVVLAGVGIAVAGGIFYVRKKNKEMNQLFVQVRESSRQIPQQKKISFLLLMFKESVKASKSKNASAPKRFSDPKQLEVQLLQMGSILKDRAKVTDKGMKQALQLLDTYLKWEKDQAGKA